MSDGEHDQSSIEAPAEPLNEELPTAPQVPFLRNSVKKEYVNRTLNVFPLSMAAIERWTADAVRQIFPRDSMYAPFLLVGLGALLANLITLSV